MPITAIVNASGVSTRLDASPSDSTRADTARNAGLQRPSERADAPSGLRQFKVLQSRSEPAQLTLAFRG